MRTIHRDIVAALIFSLNDDLAKYHWIDLDDVKNYKLTPPSVELFKKLHYIP